MYTPLEKHLIVMISMRRVRVYMTMSVSQIDLYIYECAFALYQLCSWNRVLHKPVLPGHL